MNPEAELFIAIRKARRAKGEVFNVQAVKLSRSSLAAIERSRKRAF
jgi:uncharacterized membrane protein